VIIRGLGTAVPAMTITRAEALIVANVLCGPYLTDTDWLPNVYEQSGVQQRHQVLGRPLIEDLVTGTRRSGSVFLPRPERPHGPTTAERMAIYAAEAPPLAVEAAKKAMVKASIAADAVTHLVTVSCTGFTAPGVDADLIRALNLPDTVQRTHIGYMGCHGAINGLRVAAAFTAADLQAVVLLAAVELCSLHYHYGAEPGKVIANALFADGAAAVVATAGRTGLHLRATGSKLFADSRKEMAWRIADHGFEMTLTKQVPKLIAANLRGWLDEWLSRHGLERNGIAHWIVHPGGPKILTAVEAALDLPPAALTLSREVLARCGNMSSPTVLFILERLLRAGAAGPAVILGFGPGLVAEAALVHLAGDSLR
jgi:alpha-pyrone synthase